MARLAALLGLLVLASAGASSALAHASLVAAHPADGAVLAQPPRSVRLRFNEPVSVLVVRLVGAEGEITPSPQVRSVNENVDLTLPVSLDPGGYALSYRVISADGHPVAGSITFSIGTAAAAPPLGPRRDGVVAGLLWLTRLVMHVGLFVGVGGAFFLTWMARDVDLVAARSVAKAAILVGLFGSLLAIGCQGLDALGAGPERLWTASVWTVGVTTTFGATALGATIALCLAYLGMTAQGGRRALSGAAMLGVGTALTASGHASAAGPFWLTRLSVFVHGVAVAYWIGAFVPLLYLSREHDAPVRAIVRAWSKGAVIGVAALFVTGGTLALIHIPTLVGLFATGYGWILLAKLAAVAALLILAACNRAWLTPALGSIGEAALRLRRSIAAEMALALVVLSLVGLWRFTPPPRATLAALATAHLHGARGTAELRLEPGRAGPVHIGVTLLGLDGHPMRAKEVTLGMSHPAAGIEPIERKADRTGESAWEVREFLVPVAGQWQVRIDVLVSDFEKVVMEGAVAIR
jgi:copper transport protein